MAIRKPEPLNKDHLIEDFDCGNTELTNWFIKYAKQSQSSGSANSFVVLDEDLTIGYYSLTVGQIDKINASDRVGKGMGNYPIPVVILARLAVRKNYQSKGIGAGMLVDATSRALAIAKEAGVRAILAHPIDDNASIFYKKYGFEPSPLRERQLLLLLKDAKKIVCNHSQTVTAHPPYAPRRFAKSKESS